MTTHLLDSSGDCSHFDGLVKSLAALFFCVGRVAHRRCFLSINQSSTSSLIIPVLFLSDLRTLAPNTMAAHLASPVAVLGVVTMQLLVLLRGRTVAAGHIFTVQEEGLLGEERGSISNVREFFSSSGIETRNKRFRLFKSDPRADVFDVNPKKGTLYVKRRVDRESLCPNVKESPCNIDFAVITAPETNLNSMVSRSLSTFDATQSDDSDRDIEHFLSLPHRACNVQVDLHTLSLFCVLQVDERVDIRVTVLDKNDSPPHWRAGSELRLKLIEAGPGHKIHIPAAIDADIGQNAKVDYQLKNKGAPFKLVRDNNKLILDASAQLDREKQANYSMELKAIDGGSPPLTGTIMLKVRSFSFDLWLRRIHSHDFTWHFRWKLWIQMTIPPNSYARIIPLGNPYPKTRHWAGAFSNLKPLMPM